MNKTSNRLDIYLTPKRRKKGLVLSLEFTDDAFPLKIIKDHFDEAWEVANEEIKKRNLEDKDFRISFNVE